LRATLAFLARQGDRGAYTIPYKIHQAVYDPLVWVDPGAAQYFTAIPRARPAGDLLRAVAVLQYIGRA